VHHALVGLMSWREKKSEDDLMVILGNGLCFRKKSEKIRGGFPKKEINYTKKKKNQRFVLPMITIFFFLLNDNSNNDIHQNNCDNFIFNLIIIIFNKIMM
jgi:hypothetical protein